MQGKTRRIKPLKINVIIGTIFLSLCIVFGIIDSKNKLGFFNREIFSFSPILGIILIVLFSAIVFFFFFAFIKGIVVLIRHPNDEEKKGRASENIDIVNVIPIFIFIFLLLDCFFISPVRVSGESMMNTLSDQELLLTVHTKNIHKDDIVILNKDDEDLIIKRVVAEPGDKIRVTVTGMVFVNDELIENSAAYNAPIMYYHEKILNDGEYYVLGDNRNISNDSRMHGIFTEDDICGKVIFSISKFKIKLDKQVIYK
ncbi:signal peptidase I [bacterium]|nr:signal peptidase I [bacterium]